MGAKGDFIERYPHLVYSSKPNVATDADEFGYLYILVPSTDGELPDVSIGLIGYYDNVESLIQGDFIQTDANLATAVIDNGGVFLYRLSMPRGTYLLIYFNDVIEVTGSIYNDGFPIPFYVDGQALYVEISNLAIDDYSMPPEPTSAEMAQKRYPMMGVQQGILI